MSKETPTKPPGKDLSTRFKKGKSANPRGRPKGTKNKLTVLNEALRNRSVDYMIKHLEPILKAVAQKAEEGDMTAAKLILDRVLPVYKAIEVNSTATDSKSIVINISALEATVSAHEAIEGEVVEDEPD